MIVAALLAAALFLAPGAPPREVADVGGFFVTRQGAPLYLFEGDTMVGMSHCFGACARDYPPLLAPADASPSGEWTLVPRDGGARQWAYRDKPVYTSTRPAADIAKAEAEGGMWRRVSADAPPPAAAAMQAPGHMPNGPEGSVFSCQGDRRLLARFVMVRSTPTAIVDVGEGPHALALAPWTGGEPRVTWSDGVRTLVWSTGVQLMWMDGPTHLACGRAEHHH